MKRLLITILSLVLILCAVPAFAIHTRYGRSTVDGSGAAGFDLSDIPVATITDGDTASVPYDPTYGGPLNYTYDSSSAASHSPPDVIKPDDNGGNGRWLLTQVPVKAGGTGLASGCTDTQVLGGTGSNTFECQADDDQPEAGDYAAKSIDGDDVANTIAGRSLTMNTGTSPDSMDIDDEIYTQEKCVYIEDPTTESFNNLFWWMYNVTIVYVRCETDTGTADINIEDGSDNNILTAELVCDVGGQTSCASGCDVNTISGTYDNITGKTEPVDLDISATASSPTVLIVCIGYEVDSQ